MGKPNTTAWALCSGSGIDSDLNEKGQQQALSFFKSYKHVPFDKVYTSRLKRTVQTVKNFIQEGIPTESLAGLNEIGWGICEGVQSDPSWKATYYALLESWKSGNLHTKIEGGENPWS
jgi:broad specificity phosphatase PhoE